MEDKTPDFGFFKMHRIVLTNLQNCNLFFFFLSDYFLYFWHSFMYSFPARKLVLLTYQPNARRPDRCYWIIEWGQSSDVDVLLTQSWSSLILGQSSCQFSQDTMASESPGGSPLPLFFSTCTWNGSHQLDINSLNGKKRKCWFKSSRYIAH